MPQPLWSISAPYPLPTPHKVKAAEAVRTLGEPGCTDVLMGPACGGGSSQGIWALRPHPPTFRAAPAGLGLGGRAGAIVVK